MQQEAEGRWTTIVSNTGEDAVHKFERGGVRHKEEDERRIKRIFHFQTKGETHLEDVGNFSRPQDRLQPP